MRRSRGLPLAAVLGASVVIGAACASGPARPSDAVLGKGYDVYTARCASCHGVNGDGGIGPQMKGVTSRLSVDKHTEAVRNGRSGTGMPAFGGQLTDEEIQAVVRYEREVLASGT